MASTYRVTKFDGLYSSVLVKAESTSEAWQKVYKYYDKKGLNVEIVGSSKIDEEYVNNLQVMGLNYIN